MFSNFFRRRTASNYQLFDARYIDPKALFLHFFNEIPSVSYITDIDMKRAYSYIRNKVDGSIDKSYQHSQFNHDNGCMEFNVTFFVLQFNRIIEVGADYVIIFHGRDQAGWTEQLLKGIAVYRTHKPEASKIGFSKQHEPTNN